MTRFTGSIAVLLVLVLPACGGDGDSGASTETGADASVAGSAPAPVASPAPSAEGRDGLPPSDPLSAGFAPAPRLRPFGYWAEPEGAAGDYPAPTPVASVPRSAEIPRIEFAPAPAGGAAAGARNDAVALAAVGTSAQNRLFGEAAGQGQTFMVVATRWSNVHPKEHVDRATLEGRMDRTMGVGAFASGRGSGDSETVEVDVPYRIPRLVDHVYLLADGQAIPLDPATADVPGGAAIDRAFDISRQGESRMASLVFRMPAGAQDLALQHFDYQYGNILVPLRGDPERARGSGGPAGDVLGTATSELLEVAAHGLRFQGQYGGEQAGEGKTFAVVVLGGRSLAENRSQRSIVEVDPTEYLWVRSDGGYLHYGVRPPGAERVLRFTPEVYQQQEAAFRVPEGAERLALGLRVNREVVTLELGRGAPEGMPRARATHTDGNVMEVMLFGSRRAGDHVIVDLGIRPIVEGQGLEVQARQQLLLQAGGSDIAPDPAATAALAHGPPQPFVIPPGTSVRFELAYRAAEPPTAVRVRGFRSEGRLSLD